MTAGELFMAGGLWTAGGNLVDSITEDSIATQISANKVNYVEDKTKALLEIKTNQRDSTSSFPWEILGYILLGLGMILMAIPAIKLLRWIKDSCGGGNDSIHEEKDIEEPSTARYPVKYHPDPEQKARVWILPAHAKLVTETANVRAGSKDKHQGSRYVISLTTK